jgi:glutamine amidotransferase
VSVRVALIDYRAGNLTSVRKALGQVGAEVFVAASPAEMADAGAVVVPGVGHFQATSTLDAAWRAAIVGGVAVGKPLLGICLGMQLLFEGSDEAPGLEGLGLLAGRCRLLRPARERAVGPPAQRLKVPHVGWNALAHTRPSRLLNGLADGAQAYFTHSFVAPANADTVATTEHGETFASAVERGVVFGVQFHPEKSGEVGLRVLDNFLGAARAAP